MAENDTLSLRWCLHSFRVSYKRNLGDFWGSQLFVQLKLLKIGDGRSKMREIFHIRNREVEETLSKTADFGCNEKYDKLELRNRCLGNTSQTKVGTQKLWVTSLATLFQNSDRDALSEGRPRTGREGEAGEERGERDQRRPGVWYPRAAQQVTGVYMNEYMNEYMNIRDYFSFGFAHHMLNAVVKRKSVVIYLGLSRREWDLAGQGVKPYLGFSCGA